MGSLWWNGGKVGRVGVWISWYVGKVGMVVRVVEGVKVRW